GRSRGDLGGDHSAHRMTDEVRFVDAELGDHVARVKREIQHVLEELLSRGVAIPGKLGSEHVVVLRERVQEGVFGEEAARAVKKYHRGTATLLEYAHPAASLGRHKLALHHCATSSLTSAAEPPPCARPFSPCCEGRFPWDSDRSCRNRFGIGLIHQRWSSFHCGQRSRSFG